jgi:hypothetical protein
VAICIHIHIHISASPTHTTLQFPITTCITGADVDRCRASWVVICKQTNSDMQVRVCVCVSMCVYI